MVAERENISAAFEKQRAEGLTRKDQAFEENLAALDEKAGKSPPAIEFESDLKPLRWCRHPILKYEGIDT